MTHHISLVSSALALAFLAASLVLVTPSTAYAETVTWSFNAPRLITTGAAGPRQSWTTYFRSASVSVLYGASVWEVDADGTKVRQLSTNDQVPEGTRVLFEFKPHEYTDISWTSTGNVHGTPYGDWVADAALPGPGTGLNSVICVDKNRYESVSEAKQKNIKLFAELSIAPPGKRAVVSGPGVSCVPSGSSNDRICTMDDPGSISVLFTFDPTFGYFYGGYLSNHTYVRTTCDWLGKPMETTTGSGFDSEVLAKNRSIYQMPVPTQTIPFTLNVTDVPGEDPELHAPQTPTLTSSGACVVGTPHTVNFVSTDPDGDNVRYGVDWDADGSVNEWVPPSGYVASGASQSASRTYSTTGSKTVKVMAEDEGGLTSAWATLTFSCTQTPPPTNQCSDNADNDGDGLIDSLDPDCTTSDGFSEFPPGQPPPPPPPPPPPDAVLELRAIPSLVRRGNTTQIHWSAQNVQSCTVAGDNGDSWSGTASPVGGRTSRPITGETKYTLSCVDLEGDIHVKMAKVHILFNEKEE